MRRISAVGLILLAVALCVLVFVTGEVGGKIASVATVLSVFVVVVPMAWSSSESGSTSVSEEAELETSASRLARSVLRRWTKEATQRGITAPATVRVSWRRESSPTGTARPARGARPREIPFPSDAGLLLDEGMLADLHQLYSDSDVDKLVILGRAGAGKSGILIQLLLEALRARERAPEGDRYDVPVPVLLALGDWDPTSTDLFGWADGVLTRDYGPASAASGASVYRELLEDGRIALFLDGLDEMPEQLWQVAADRIQDTAHLRVVLTARPEAGQEAYIAFAARIELDSVSVQEAVDYLRSARRQGVHPDKWEQLIDHLLGNPDSAAARALSTPLMLTLALSTFDRDRADPCTLTRFSEPEGIEEFLISRIVPVAYDPDGAGRRRPGGPTPEAAEGYLRALAVQMRRRNELAWWRVRHWAPAVAPATICLLFMAAVGVDAAVFAGAGVGLAMALPGAVVATVAGGVTASAATRSGRHRAHGTLPRLIVSTLVGVLFGACMVMVARFEDQHYDPGIGIFGLGILLGFMGGVAVGVLALHDGPLVARPRRVTPKDALFGAPAGIATGLTYGLAQETAIGAGIGLLGCLGFMVGVAWTRPSDHPEEGATPLSSFRRDLKGASLLASVILATGTVEVAIVLSQSHSVAASFGIAVGVTFPLAALVGVATSQACALVLTTIWLRLRGGSVPATLLSLGGVSADDPRRESRPAAGFLEDARSRAILRSVGTVYQFRHASLQKQLAPDAGEVTGA